LLGLELPQLFLPLSLQSSLGRLQQCLKKLLILQQFQQRL
jgi:hypothetical protein